MRSWLFYENKMQLNLNDLLLLVAACFSLGLVAGIGLTILLVTKALTEAVNRANQEASKFAKDLLGEGEEWKQGDKAKPESTEDKWLREQLGE